MAIEIVDFPIKHGVFAWQNVSSPEGTNGETNILLKWYKMDYDYIKCYKMLNMGIFWPKTWSELPGWILRPCQTLTGFGIEIADVAAEALELQTVGFRILAATLSFGTAVGKFSFEDHIRWDIMGWPLKNRSKPVEEFIFGNLAVWVMACHGKFCKRCSFKGLFSPVLGRKKTITGRHRTAVSNPHLGEIDGIAGRI